MTEFASHFPEIPRFRRVIQPVDEFDAALMKIDEVSEPTPKINKLALHLSHLRDIGATTVATAVLTGFLGLWADAQPPLPISQSGINRDNDLVTTNLRLGSACSINNKPQLLVSFDKIDPNLGQIALSITTPDGDRIPYTVVNPSSTPINTGEQSTGKINTPNSYQVAYRGLIPSIIDIKGTREVEIQPGAEYTADLGIALTNPDDGTMVPDHPLAQAKVTTATCKAS